MNIQIELKRFGFDRRSAVVAEKLLIGFFRYKIIRGLLQIFIPIYEIRVKASCV